MRASWIDALADWARHTGALGAVGYALVFVACALVMVPTVELYIGGGLIYGTVGGSLVMTAATLISALLAFAIAHTGLRTRIERRLARHRRLAAFDQGIGDHAFWVAVLVRLAPILPFGPTSYALSATRMALPAYAASTLVGTVPTTVLFAYAGSLIHRVAEVNHVRGVHAALLWGGIAASVALTLALGWIAKRALDHAAHRC